MYHPFSVAETVKTSWTVLKKNFITLVVYTIISLVVYLILKFISAVLLLDDDDKNDIIFNFIQLIVQSYLTLGFYRLILTLMDREYYEFDFKEILPSFRMILNFILVIVLLCGLISIYFLAGLYFRRYSNIMLGLEIVELIITAYLLIRSIFCVCFIVDDNSKTIESLKQSFELTRDNFFNALLIVLIMLGIMIITLLPIVFIVSFFVSGDDDNTFIRNLASFVWFIISFPTVQVLIMVAYRKLVYSHLDVDDDLSETL
jgi:membrane-anchored glycerophosphoryl diester phosphodiesterase (GDPDase)